MTEDRWAELRALAEAATPGQWETAECEGSNRDSRRTLGTYSLIHGGRREVAIVRGFSTEREPDAAFIAAARQAVPDLLAEVGRLTEALRGMPLSEFVGSVALIEALHDTYVEHIGIVETDPLEGANPYMWCACGWRSDDLDGHGIRSDNPGLSYAVHLTNAQHAAAVKALQAVGKIRAEHAEADRDQARADLAALRAGVEARADEWDAWAIPRVLDINADRRSVAKATVRYAADIRALLSDARTEVSE